jgi:multiple sugar transport system permease protein/raffinose/stachyose/melibiose transport system permease protein
VSDLVVTARVRPTARTRRRAVGYLFVLPIALFFAVFVAFPFLRSFYLSLTEWSGFTSPRFIGLRNFQSLADDPVFWKALRTTIVYTAVTTILQTTLPMLLAAFVNIGWRGGVVFRTLLFIPVIVSFVVTALLWQLIYDPNFGTLNEVLRAVGLDGLAHPWLADPTTVVPAIMLVSLWQSLGFYMLIFLAGLQGIDPNLYEAARIDGAGARQEFLRITVPMLRTVTAVVVLLNLINGFNTFDIIYVMTRGGPANGTQTVAYYAYLQAFSNQLFGYGAALAYMMALFILGIALVYIRLLRQEVEF